MDILTVDKLGCVVLPKPLRVQFGLKPGAQLLAVPLGDRLVLEPMDAAALARRMHEELKGVDIDRIVREIKAEVDVFAKAEIERILAGHKPLRGRRQRNSAKDKKP